jgi:opacity protein-like surface antigen
MTSCLSRAARLLALFALGLAAPAGAQDPAGPPPAPSGSGHAGPYVHELLPDIGRIGAQAGLIAGASWNPYDAGRGVLGGGYIDLPLLRAPGGKVSFQAFFALSHAESDPFTATNPIAFVANLAAGAGPVAALAGPPAAPFPVTRSVRTRLRLLQLSPFGLKYTVLRLDHLRLRPYALAGLDYVVAITKETPEKSESLLFTGQAPFDAPLIAGLVAQAAELEARGTPSGQGNVEFGFHAGAGLEFRATRALSLNLEYRYTGIEGPNARLHALTSALGFHW